MFQKFVRTHPTEIEWIRQGSAKAHLGWVIGGNGSANDPELWPNQRSSTIDATREALILAELPPLGFLRELATILRADAIVAGRTADPKRVLRDIHSTLDL